MNVAIKAVELSKRYDDVEALRDVNLEIYRNEIVVLLGPNGSGKSTFIKISAGVLFPTSGKIEVFGREPYRYFEIKGLLSYMPQDQGLYGSLTGYENYLFYSGIQGIDKKEALSYLKDAKVSLGLGEWFFKRRVNAYSGGMKRKTSLIVALSSDPKLLIMDEPTTGLDPSTRRDFWRIMLDLKKKGKTIIMATHLFEDAEVIADRIIIMFRGKVLTFSTPEELKSKIGYKYAIDIEFAEEPSRTILEKMKDDETEIVYDKGFIATLLCNDTSIIEDLDSKLRDVKYVSFNLRKIGLRDIYFLLTGVRLE